MAIYLRRDPLRQGIVKLRIGMAMLVALVAGVSSRAAETRAELMFAIHSALQTGNRGYLERCFQWDDADPASRGRAKAILDEILRWRTPHLGETDRDSAAGGAAAAVKLNGDWTFQIHFHNGPPPSASFVFPAGRAGDEVKILLMAGQGDGRYAQASE